MSSIIDSVQGRRKLQIALSVKGFYKGEIDGVLGPASAQAIRDFRQSIGLAPTASVDAKLLEALGIDGPIYDPPKSAANAEFTDLMKSVLGVVIAYYLRGNLIMSADQLGGILRAIIPALVAYAAAKGWIMSGQVADVSAAIITLLVAGWSVYTNRPAALAPKA